VRRWFEAADLGDLAQMMGLDARRTRIEVRPTLTLTLHITLTLQVRRIKQRLVGGMTQRGKQACRYVLTPIIKRLVASIAGGAGRHSPASARNI
jgi:hypothetical protein